MGERRTWGLSGEGGHHAFGMEWDDGVLTGGGGGGV